MGTLRGRVEEICGLQRLGWIRLQLTWCIYVCMYLYVCACVFAWLINRVMCTCASSFPMTPHKLIVCGSLACRRPVGSCCRRAEMRRGTKIRNDGQWWSSRLRSESLHLSHVYLFFHTCCEGRSVRTWYWHMSWLRRWIIIDTMPFILFLNLRHVLCLVIIFWFSNPIDRFVFP